MFSSSFLNTEISRKKILINLKKKSHFDIIPLCATLGILPAGKSLGSNLYTSHQNQGHQLFQFISQISLIIII